MGERNLEIQFSKKIIQHTKEANINMDLMGSVMFVLFGLFDGQVEMLDCADDSNREKRMGILYRQLERRGFLEKDEGDGLTVFKLTPMGNEFVTRCREEYEQELKEGRAPVVVKEEENTLAAEIVASYRELWPKGRVTDDGKHLRDHPGELITRMKGFLKKYPYDKETILRATEMYISEQAASPDGHRYTRNSKYFIWKDDITMSDLATWCQRILDGEDFEQKQQYDTKAFDIM